MEIIGGFFMPPTNMEDSMTRKDFYFVRITAE